MAVLACCANGNLTTAATWAAVDSTTYLNSETGNTALSTTESSNRAASGTTPGAITVDGIALKIASRSASPTGTMSVQLWNVTDTAAVAGTSVTVNVSDLPSCASADLNGGWVFLKFSAPVTLTAGKAYIASPVTSSGSMVNLFRDATTSNWAKALRTTTTQAPVAGDDLIVTKEWTAAATGTARAVTMDSTAATDYGSNTTSAVTPAISVCQGGTLSYGTTGSTNYVLRVSGHIVVYSGGTFSVGASGAEIPRTSTAVLEFDCAADGDFGLIARNLSTLNIAGLSRTSGKDVSWCLLNADAAANATSLTVDTDTGWLDNDVIVVASTDRPGTVHTEAGALNGNAGASSLTVDGFGGTGGGVAFAHLGGSTSSSSQTVTLPDTTTNVVCKMQAEIINLTRNVIVRGTTAGQMTFVFAAPTAQVYFRWAEFTLMGANVAGKRGIECDTSTAGSLDIRFCSFHDSEFGGLWLSPSTTDFAAAQIKDNVFYNIAVVTTAVAISVNTIRTGGGNYVIDRNVMISFAGFGIRLFDITGTCTNNRVVAQTGQYAYGLEHASTATVAGKLDGNVAHSCGGSGSIRFNAQWSEIHGDGWRFWRNTNGSAEIHEVLAPSIVFLSNIAMWGSQNGQIVSTGSLNAYISNMVVASDSVTNNSAGLFIDGGLSNIVVDNSVFSVSAAAGGFLRPLVNDIATATSGTYPNGVKIICRNCSFGGSSTIVSNPAALTVDGYVSMQRYGGTAGSHRTYVTAGLLTNDTTIFNAASPSLRMAPTSASVKCVSAPLGRGVKIAVGSGETITVNVYTRKSAVGDGAAYNGNQPRLIVRANPALGITTDTVLDTHTAATGTWEQLSGTTAAVTDDGALEFYVDCDGTAGWVNVDDWSHDRTADAKGSQYWFNGLPVEVIPPTAAVSGARVIGG